MAVAGGEGLVVEVGDLAVDSVVAVVLAVVGGLAVVVLVGGLAVVVLVGGLAVVVVAVVVGLQRSTGQLSMPVGQRLMLRSGQVRMNTRRDSIQSAMLVPHGTRVH